MKNGERLCTVGSDDVWMFSAGVWGDIWGPEASFLDVSGGSKPRDDGESDFLIWQMPCELARSDCLEFFFEEGSVSTPEGRRFDPADYVSEEPKIKISSPPTDEDIAKLESRPALNIGLAWSFSLNDAPAIALAPDSTRQHISLSLLWNDRNSLRLRVRLSKKSLREIVARRGGEEVLSEYVPLGSKFRITIG